MNYNQQKLILSVSQILLSLGFFQTFYINATTTNLLTQQNILPNLLTYFVQSNSAERGRVQIANNTLVADNGFKLKGEHLRISELVEPPYAHLQRAYDYNVWADMIEDAHLNTVRLLLYRPPQWWSGTDGCPPPERCFSTVQEAVPHIDAMVNIASSMGMYVIIDYHPIGGYDQADAETWWNILAPRYKDRTHVIYELSNEPVQWSAASYTAQDVEFQEDLYQLIRAHAPNTHIILWSFAEASGDGDNMLTAVQSSTVINYNNASVGYHPYGNYNENEMQALKNAGYAIINTEIGGQSRTDYLDRTTAAENLGVSWIWLDGTGIDKGWDPLPVTWPQDPKTNPIRPSVWLPIILRFLQ